MNDDLRENIYTLAFLDLTTGVKTAYWATDSERWRMEMDEDTFLREIKEWEPMPHPDPDYPVALVWAHGQVDVFCLVKKVPE